MDQHVIDGLTVLPPLLAEYRFDPIFEIKHNLVSFEQGYSFEYHNMFKNTRDVSFNKSSNFYLTDQYHYNDIVSMKSLPRQYPETISSFLVFNRIDTDPLSALSANSTCLTSNSATSALSADDTTSVYMTIIPTPGDTGDATTSRKLSAELFVDARTKDSLEQKYYFNIMFINGYQCLIYHLIDDDRYYLSFDSDASDPVLQFIKVTHDFGLENNVDEILADAPGKDGDDIVFMYNYIEPDNLIRLYKTHGAVNKVVKLLSDEAREIDPYTPPITLEPLIDPDQDSDSSTNAPNILELTPDTTLRLRPRLTKVTELDLNSRVYNYTNTVDQNNVNVDPLVSEQDLSNNMLAHSEYYYLTGTSIPVNIFPLKNQQTDSGLTLPTNTWNQSKYNHRRYNKLFTGTNQLKGSDKIYMDYTSSSFDIHLKPGMNYFNFPQECDPVVKLNINDAGLETCGAISSNRPSGSDKVFKKLASYEQYTNWGNPTNEQTGTWLCAWLSGGSTPDVKPVWMDRYYNPSKIGGTLALTTETTYLHDTHVSDTDNVFASTSNEVIDVPSQLTFEPGCAYAYYRQNAVDYSNNISNLDPYLIQSGLSNYRTINDQPQPDTGVYNFNLDNVATIDNITKQSAAPRNFTLTFDLDLKDYKKSSGHQLIGNYTDKGFGLFNTNDVSPFVFIPGPDGARVSGTKQDSSIRIYDNNYNLYNYTTNDSFLGAGESPALFKKLIVRELPDTIFCIMTDGKILEMSHDGVITSMYDSWVTKYSDNTGAYISDVAYDEQDIYILTVTGTTSTDISIDMFNMYNKSLSSMDLACVTPIPIPETLINNVNETSGRSLSGDTPPTLIYVKDDHEPYQENRSVYIGYGDSIKATSDTLWVHVAGEQDAVSKSQIKHDVIYGFNTKKLQLLDKGISDNNLNDPTVLLEVVDYLTDSNDNIWIAHNTSYVSKFNNDRNVLTTKNVFDQQILSMVISRDLIAGTVTENLVVLAKLVGTDELQMQIGPALHPTDNPEDPSYRKASPYIESGDYTERPTYIDPETFDDTIEIIYPFTQGAFRFGEHIYTIADVPSTETTGRVTPGDYTLMTEGLDIIVNEAEDVMYGHVFNIDNATLIETKTLTDFPIDDISIKPQMFNHYEYSKENYNKYSKYNLNLKLSLDALFENVDPDYVNLKFNLEKLNKSSPYTGMHNIAVVIDNDNGRVELWVDGELDELTRVHEFDVNKHTFHQTLNTNITVGATPYLKNTLLPNKISRKDAYICNNMTIKNINCYSKALTRQEQIDVIRSTSSPEGMYWTLPSSLRNYIEGVDRVFNHSIPPSKSNVYDIEIRNSLIQLEQLQQYIQNKVSKSLIKYTSGSTKTRNIKWLNELLLT